MNNLKTLPNSDLRHECGDNAYERGRLYYEKGHVLNLTIISEGTLFVQINATVKGSDQLPYKQNVRIAWRPDFSSVTIDGDCTCPVGYNCKHVVAVCLMYQNKDQQLSLPSLKDTSCLDWLDSLAPKTAAIDTHDEFIAYVLKPGKLKHEFAVDLYITRAKKNGGFNKGRKSNLSTVRYGSSYLAYIHPDDQEITQLLSALNPTYMGEPVLTGAAGYLALTKLLATERVFWQDLEHAPLKEGELRELNFNWRQQEQGDYELEVNIVPPAKLLLTEPACYLDVKTGTVGPLGQNHLTTHQLKKVLEAPVIPRSLADAFSERLAIEHPELALPAPKPVSVIKIEEITPKPRLLLFGRESNPRQYLHLIAVAFDYGEHTLSASPNQAYSVLKTERGLLQISRNTKFEQAVLDRLLALGFSVIDDPDLQELVLYSPNQLSTIESTTRWANFIREEVPVLDREGWQITIADSFELNIHSVDDWDAEISESKNNWFEMRFNIKVGQQSLPLLPLIMPLLEHYDLDSLPEIINVPINQQNCVSLPSKKIRPFLAVLFELFDNTNFETNGTLKLNPYHAASFNELESQNRLFTFRGGDLLRSIGQKLKNFAGIENVVPPANLQASLRNYQQQGLNWLQFLREYQLGGILADDMGLGKTLQTLAHLLLEKQQGRMNAPVLIIAPTSLMANWKREANRFTPELSVLILQGNDRKEHFDQIRSHDLVLTTYPLLPRDEEILLEYQYYYVILDEAQTIKNPNAKASKIVRRIKAHHRLCLTGTPMENHLGELWAQFDFLMPGFLGDSASFKKRYRNPIEQLGDAETQQSLSRRLLPFMLRRSKQAVAAELPAKTEILCTVPLHEQQAALYESVRLSMEKKVREAIAQRGLARSHITILDALLKLRQTCCDPRILNLAAAQKVLQSAKLDLLMDILPNQLEEGRRILVFSQFTRMIGLIEQELNKRNIVYAKLTGQTKDREGAIEQFKNGSANVFLISLKAGGVGLNLTEADTVILYDPWWNPATEDQAADRAHRIGQDKPVFIYKLLAENTVEEKILALQAKKRALAEGVYQNETSETFASFSAEELSGLFDPIQP